MPPTDPDNKHYVYMIECSNGHLYTGYTTCIERRYEEHVKGSAKCKYTRSFPPKRLAACWEVPEGKSAALQLERHIKSLSKQQKLALCSHQKTSEKE